MRRATELQTPTISEHRLFARRPASLCVSWSRSERRPEIGERQRSLVCEKQTLGTARSSLHHASTTTDIPVSPTSAGKTEATSTESALTRQAAVADATTRKKNATAGLHLKWTR